jgi:hypothetical protein
VRRLSTNRPPQSVKSPVHSPSELWNAFGACGGLMGVKCHSRLPLAQITWYIADRPPEVRGRACAQAASASYASCRSGSI